MIDRIVNPENLNIYRNKSLPLPARFQMALALLNGDYVHNAVQAGAKAQLKDDRAPTAADVERLFLSTLSRRPTKDEGKAMLELMRGGEGAAGLEDVRWAGLNSAEFNSNH